MDFSLNKEYAIGLDREDPLAEFRQRFVIDEPDLIYLDGNSLGRLPKASQKYVQDVINHEWGQRLIRGWNEGWYESPSRIGSKLAKLLGANEDEVLIADSTSINLFKLVIAALKNQSGRKKILTDNLNFPSDVYILRSAIQSMGDHHELQIISSEDEIHGPVEKLQNAMDSDTALVTLCHAVFKSAYIYDVKSLTQIAKQNGALTLWDFSHTVGAVPIHLNDWEVDLAVGSTYKYLNGGPGSPAFLYIRKELQQNLENPISGWFGHEQPFKFDLEFKPAETIRRFLTGTPSILSLAAIEPAIDLINQAGIERIRDKSIKQVQYLIYLFKEILQPLGFFLKSPTEPNHLGSHISLSHEQASRICRALIEAKNVIVDFRKPDNIRLGVSPLYTSYLELFEAVMRMKEVMVDSLYQNYSMKSFAVT
ncbi:kynureninase [candidate division KSB1 bacterium]|nr:kynureninase [candidate division KSB1 bacterium]